MKKWLFRILLGLVALVVTGALVFLVSSWTATGKGADGERLARMKQSPQWKNEAFTNALLRVDGEAGEMLSAYVKDVRGKSPEKPIEINKLTRAAFATPPASGLRITWLGHSTFILEVDGARILIDPVWGERASPVTWAGPARFHEPPLPLKELPEIDAVLISHDHYDHLDYPTVAQMLDTKTQWLVPLGIGAHLEYWGVDKSRITEFDWWEDREVKDLKITCTPSRHFSGRSLTSQNATLWSGWAIAGPAHRVFYSGDTAMHPAFKDIGEKLGPFDVSILETGAYSPMWADVHLGPEQALIAHQMVGAKVFLPVHWGTFDLALHPWVEPIERVLAAAKKIDAKVIAPRPGGMVEVTDDVVASGSVDAWWDAEIPWETVDKRPAWSSGVDDLLQDSPLFSR